MVAEQGVSVPCGRAAMLQLMADADESDEGEDNDDVVVYENVVMLIVTMW